MPSFSFIRRRVLPAGALAVILFGATLTFWFFKTKDENPIGLREKLDLPRTRFGSSVPDFTAATLDGKAWRLKDQKGKVVLLHFWATYCGPCRLEIPVLQEIALRYRGYSDFVIANVAVDDDPNVVLEFVRAKEMVGLHLMIRAGSPVIPGEFKVWGLPTTWIISRDQRMAPCPLDSDGLREMIEGVLKISGTKNGLAQHQAPK